MTAEAAGQVSAKDQAAIEKLLNSMESLEDVARVMSNLFSHCGLRELVCDFDGSGDSCDCFDVRVKATPQIDCIDQSLSRFIELQVKIGVNCLPEIATRSGDHIRHYRKALEDRIETLLFDFIAKDNTGWEIDHGSSGRIIIDFLEDKLSFEITVRNMVYDTTTRTHCISTGKELSSTTSSSTE